MKLRSFVMSRESFISSSFLKEAMARGEDLSRYPSTNHQEFNIGDEVMTRYFDHLYLTFYVLSVSAIDEKNISEFRSYGYPHAQLGDTLLSLGDSPDDTGPRFATLPRWQQVINISSIRSQTNARPKVPANE
jgi:hypothetical protein